MKLLTNLLLLVLATMATFIVGRGRRPAFVGRARVGDTAFTGRMGAGFSGDVSRVHPAAIEPCLIDEDDPPLAYGWPVVVDAVTHGVRQLLTADASDDDPLRPWGFTVRPYPMQVASATNYGAESHGAAIPPASGVIDVLKLGYIMAKVNGAPVKGGAVFVWTAASAGDHVEGQLEAAADAGNTVELSNCFFNSGADANGVAEVVIQD